MIDHAHSLPLARQAKALGIGQGSVYYLPKPVSAVDLAITRAIDELHMQYSFAGSLMLRDLLRQEGFVIGRLRVGSLMKKMAIVRHNQLCATDNSYIPMAKEFIASVDWFSRNVRSWLMNVTVYVGFCVEALEEALARDGKPAILHANQGCQFTSQAFTSLLHREQITISMDAWRGNVVVERLWRSVKYGEVYLRADESVAQARSSIGQYVAFYSGRIPHSSLRTRTRDQMYFDNIPLLVAAWKRQPIWSVIPVGFRPSCMTNHIGGSAQLADYPFIFCQSMFDQTVPPLFI